MARTRLEPRGSPGDDTRWSRVARAAKQKKALDDACRIAVPRWYEIRARPPRRAARRQSSVADPRAHEAIGPDAFRCRAEARAQGGTLDGRFCEGKYHELSFSLFVFLFNSGCFTP
jgi:hypothetical protein